MKRVQRNEEWLRAELSPRSSASRAVASAIFCIAQAVVAIVLFVHGSRSHWHCDDPSLLWLFAGLSVTGCVFALSEQRRLESLELDRAQLRFKRGWGPLAKRVEAPLDTVRCEEAGHGVLLTCPGAIVRIASHLSRREREHLCGAIQHHLAAHVVRLR
jgi:hypothetical protein